MAKNYWNIVDNVIRNSDVIIEVLDARFIEETRNKELDNRIKSMNKKIIYAINKSDLIDTFVDDIILGFKNYVFVSAKKNLGTTRLRNMIRNISDKKPLTVGVVGYPNTGKSSIINSLKHKKSAATSPVAGFTKGMQKIKVSDDVYLIDTPGVIHYSLEDEAFQVMINAKDINKIKDYEAVALKIIKHVTHVRPEVLERLYGIKIKENPENTLEEIAKKFNWLMKGGKLNLELASKRIIGDWQKGNIRL